MTYVANPAANTKLLGPTTRVKIWVATTAELRKSLLKEEKTVLNAIAVSPDMKLVAISGIRMEKTQAFVKIVDAETGAVKQELVPPPPGELPQGTIRVNALVFSPDGKTLVMGGHGHEDDWDLVKLLDVAGKATKDTSKFATPTRPGKESEWSVLCLAYSPDGEVLASAEWGRVSQKARIQLYDGQTGEPKGGWDIGDCKGNLQIALAADGKSLATVTGPVKLWDIRTGKELRTWDTKGWEITRIAMSRDGRYLAAGGTREVTGKSSAKVLLLDAKTGESKRTFPWLYPAVMGASLAFSPDSRALAVCGRPAPNAESMKAELRIIPLGP